jgi:folate-dependent phosphoribosylglycinamide formyltransferase PurN
MRILICSKRDLSSVVILNDLLGRLAGIPGCTASLMLAERTRKVETTVAELIHMKVFERDLPFGVLFPLIEGRSGPGPRETRALVEIVERYNMPLASIDPGPVPAGRSLRTLNRLLEWHGLSHVVVRRLNDPEVIAAAEAFSPDLILSVRFSFFFRPPFIGMAKHGVINVHPGRLPDYAGLYPHFYSMMAGERTVGCTVHVVDGGIDSGPILAAGEVPIVTGRSAFANNLESHLLGNGLVVKVVEALMRGERLAGVPQDPDHLKQHTYPTHEEFRAFQMKGFALIDMGEYLNLLRRFGLFGSVSALPSGVRLPDSEDSDKLKIRSLGV